MSRPSSPESQSSIFTDFQSSAPSLNDIQAELTQEKDANEFFQEFYDVWWAEQHQTDTVDIDDIDNPIIKLCNTIVSIDHPDMDASLFLPSDMQNELSIDAPLLPIEEIFKSEIEEKSISNISLMPYICSTSLADLFLAEHSVDPNAIICFQSVIMDFYDRGKAGQYEYYFQYQNHDYCSYDELRLSAEQYRTKILDFLKTNDHTALSYSGSSFRNIVRASWINKLLFTSGMVDLQQYKKKKICLYYVLFLIFLDAIVL